MDDAQDHGAAARRKEQHLHGKHLPTSDGEEREREDLAFSSLSEILSCAGGDECACATFLGGNKKWQPRWQRVSLGLACLGR